MLTSLTSLLTTSKKSNSLKIKLLPTKLEMYKNKTGDLAVLQSQRDLALNHF